MHSQENCFTPFNASISEYDLPERFTFPFYYQPHALCLLAAKELQTHLETQVQWQHNFGLGTDVEAIIGKMFGVLLVQNAQNDIGYLAAFSGKLADKNLLPKFVPPVFDMLRQDSFFLGQQGEINRITGQIDTLAQQPELAQLEGVLAKKTALSEQQIQAQRDKIINGRKARKAQRESAEKNLLASEILTLNKRLSQQSIFDKNQLRDVKFYWDQQLLAAQQNLHRLSAVIAQLKDQRKALSAALQQQLFEQYSFLNILGVEKNLQDIFLDKPPHIPPAGAGACAAPKLLHFAFKNGMKPLAMAEFWWGAAPKSEIRQHKNFYPACQGKCRPILGHMLDGITLDDNPLLINPALGKSLDIVYQDETLLVINKPAEFLSVPGKNIKDSVYLRIKQSFPSATGPLIVHRLDMSTSGLMVIALTKQAHKHLQGQFIKRSVEKRYVALLDGVPQQQQGFIDLPLRVDFDDTPRQLVCDEHGKAAQTTWQVIAQQGQQSRVYLYPKTGRTHQLRVHCAHALGLNMPIVGDDLYGNKAERLHLHAQLLAFNHPVTKELMQFELEPEF